MSKTILKEVELTTKEQNNRVHKAYFYQSQLKEMVELAVKTPIIDEVEDKLLNILLSLRIKAFTLARRELLDSIIMENPECIGFQMGMEIDEGCSIIRFYDKPMEHQNNEEGDDDFHNKIMRKVKKARKELTKHGE